MAISVSQPLKVLSPPNFSFSTSQLVSPSQSAFTPLAESVPLPAGHFYKSCTWSPDFSRLMTVDSTNEIKIYRKFGPLYDKDIRLDSDHLNCTSTKLPNQILSVDWYPNFDELNPLTRCFIESTPGTPVHLWDSEYRCVRGSYRMYKNAEHLSYPFAIKFSYDGQKIFCGSKNCFYIFHTSNPGDSSQCFVTYDPPSKTGIEGTICSFSTHHEMLSVGTFQKQVGVFDMKSQDLCHKLLGHKTAISYTKFSQSGNFLFTSAKNDPEILVWDLRNSTKVLMSIKRAHDTNQKLFFDFVEHNETHFLVTGNCKGSIGFYNLSDLNSESQSNTVGSNASTNEILIDFAEKFYNLASQSVSSVSFNRKHNLLAAVTGDRSAQKTKLNSKKDDSKLDMDGQSDSSAETMPVDFNENKLYILGISF